MEEENELIVKDNDEMLEQTNESENTDTQTVEENVEDITKEETTEEKKKEFTQSELDKMFKERAERADKKAKREVERVKREYEEKYSGLENILNAALGTKTPEEATQRLKDFYEKEGVNIPETPKYSDRDLELLAKAEADSIISSGYEDIVDEVDRLANKGFENMTQREKLLFRNLETERKKQATIKELESIGVTREKLEDSKYKEFSSKLNPELSEKEKYELYLKFNPKEKVESIGSMKTTKTKDEVKDFYTFEEASKFTRKDFDNNPKLFEAVEKSMPLWSKK